MGIFSYTGAALANLVGNTPGANVSNLVTLLNDVKTFINGPNLDETNVPNLSAAFTTYETILWGGGTTNSTITVGTWFMYAGPNAGSISTVTGSGLAGYAFYFDPTDWMANARTTKLRLRVACHTNAVASGLTLTPGLYPVTTFAGASGATPTITAVGTVIAGSTVQFVTPAASSVVVATSGDFNAPLAGHYVLMLNQSSGMPANSQVTFTVQVQMRQV